MSGAVLRGMSWLAPLMLIGATGCAGVMVVESSGPVPWSGMGVSLSLPAGSWEVEEIDPGYVVEFRKRGGPAHIVLMRVPARKNEGGVAALRRLFVHFDDKRRTARWSGPLRSGIAAEFAAYTVSMDGRELRITACAVRQGSWTYDLVVWGLDRAVVGAVADSMIAQAGRCSP